MRTFYLIEGFDSLNCHHFIPDPGLFKTESEAMDYVEKNSTETLLFGIKLVRLGHME